MDVQLYVYDLSQGLARAMSMAICGIQIDAIYHTSVVMNGIEYFFGLGIQQCRAGMTHLGPPMQVLPLGKTELPLSLIEEYLVDVADEWTAEKYNLVDRNCNNFSDAFAEFLIGKGIPSYIIDLPRRFLESPFGRMMAPQMEMLLRDQTQAPVPAAAVPGPLGGGGGGGGGARPPPPPEGGAQRRTGE